MKKNPSNKGQNSKLGRLDFFCNNTFQYFPFCWGDYFLKTLTLWHLHGRFPLKCVPEAPFCGSSQTFLKEQIQFWAEEGKTDFYLFMEDEWEGSIPKCTLQLKSILCLLQARFCRKGLNFLGGIKKTNPENRRSRRGRIETQIGARLQFLHKGFTPGV